MTAKNKLYTHENYRFFLQQWSKYIEPVAETYAYCLMPNHIHFLIKTRAEEEIESLLRKKTTIQTIQTSKVSENLGGLTSRKENLIIQHFSNLFNSYAKAYNKMYDRRGSLFMSNFKKKEVTSDDYFTQLIFYIHHNPVHHGFTRTLADWPHSSYHALISDKQTRLNRQEVLDWFGTKNEMKKFHDQTIKGLDKLELDFT